MSTPAKEPTLNVPKTSQQDVELERYFVSVNDRLDYIEETLRTLIQKLIDGGFITWP